MSQPYMKPGLQWEDPLDGKGPKKHRSQKKGARQNLRKELKRRLAEKELDQ